MVKDFSAISELKSIRDQKSKLSERESELSKPMFDDQTMIKRIYEIFKGLTQHRNCPGRNESVHQRKKFIFIILFMYAPSVLAGGRMPLGLRDAIASAIGIVDKTFISHNISSVVVLYNFDKAFRHDIDYIYTEIIERLKN